MLTVDHLLLLVEAFCGAAGCSEGALSKRLFNDGKRIGLMRTKNGDIGSRHLIRAVAWLSDNWPGQTAWPSNITRPESAPDMREAS